MEDLPDALDLEWLKSLKAAGEVAIGPIPPLDHIDPFRAASQKTAHLQKVYWYKRWINSEGPVGQWLMAEESIALAESHSARKEAIRLAHSLKPAAEQEWSEAYFYLNAIKPIQHPKPRKPAFVGNW